jgi:hypothetical protein
MQRSSAPSLSLLILLALTLSACNSTEDDPGVRIERYDGPPIERTEFMDWVGQVEETLTGTRVVLTSAIGRDSLILFYEPNRELPVGGAVYYLDPNSVKLFSEAALKNPPPGPRRRQSDREGSCLKRAQRASSIPRSGAGATVRRDLLSLDLLGPFWIKPKWTSIVRPSFSTR